MERPYKMNRFKYSLTVMFLLIFSLIITPPSYTANKKYKKSGEIAFNFLDVEIPTVIRFISDITGYNFVFDEKIKGSITIIAPTKLTIDESFTLFTSVLALKGYTIIPSGPKTYKIIPSSLAKQEGIISEDETLPVNAGYITKLIPVENIKVEETLKFLRPMGSRDGHVSSFGPRNLLLVVDSAFNINKIMTILKLIDKPSVIEEEARINVYFLENADAEELATVLQGIIKDLRNAYKTAGKPPKKNSPPSMPFLSVTPDKTTNSLIIVAPPTDYQSLIGVIKTLDKRRRQVYVEAMIVEATVDKLQELGTRWRATATHNGEPIAVGGFGNINPGTIVDIITGLTGFSAGGMGNFLDIPVTAISGDGTITQQTLTAPGFAALFSLEEFKNAINVLSTPQILTSDNEEAEIFVGENVPFISQRERDVVTTNTVLNSIERTDAGIILNITPQITEGDYVKLDIYQEISAVEDASDEILTTVGPTTTKRATKTSVIVKDGRTVVIGGLMQEREEKSVSKVPLMGDIPILGWLFKFNRVSRNKTNLLVFLSPHIVKESDELAQVTGDRQREFFADEKNYSEDQFMVKFDESINQQRARQIIETQGLTVIDYFESINVYLIKLNQDLTVEEAISEFSALPEVIYAEPDYKVKIQPMAHDRTVGGSSENTYSDQ
jgi:general secretion pathway protein D